MIKATGQHGSYYEAWRRKHNVQPDLLQSDKRLTDTSTYLTFLETQLERVSAACTSMKGLTTTIEQQQHETAALEQKLLSVTELITLAQSFSEEQAKQQQRELAEQRAVIESMSSRLAELERSAQASELKQAATAAAAAATAATVSLQIEDTVGQQARDVARMSSLRLYNDRVNTDEWKRDIEQQLDALRNQWQHEQLQLDQLNAQLEEHLRQQQQQQQQQVSEASDISSHSAEFTHSCNLTCTALLLYSHVFQTAQSSVVLSSEWQQLQDDNGRTYYYNTQTGVSSWQGPNAAIQYSTINDETITAVTDETAAENSEHQQHFDAEVSAAASSAQYDTAANTTAHNIDHTLELGQLREAVAHIALSQETAEQLMKQHIADAISALKSDFEQQMNAATAASQTQLSAEVAQLQAEFTGSATACTAATQALQADVTAVNEQLQQQQQQQQHDAIATTAHSLAALQSSLNDRAARAEAVAKALAVQSLKYAREQRDHVMTAVQALEAELQAIRSSCSSSVVSEAAVLQCAAAAVDSKLASFEAAALRAVSAQSSQRSAGSYSGTSPASNFNSDFNSSAPAATAASSVSVSALAQEQCKLRALLTEQDVRLSKDIAGARSRLSSFLDVYCTAQVHNVMFYSMFIR
jgi:WW domain